MGLFFKTNYEKSKSITKVKFDASERACKLLDFLMKSSNDADRQEFGQELLDELCDLAQIDVVDLKISDSNQKHRRKNGKLVMKQHGLYVPRKKYIFIQVRTAIQGKIVAPKTFLDTLLHEWTHHYDFCKLKINSIHTSGFYARLGNLKQKLKWS